MKRRSRVVDYLVYLGVRALAGIFLAFPIEPNLRTARLIGWLWYRLIGRHRQRALEHLRASFGGQLSDQQLARIALRCMQQMVMMAVEVIFMPRLVNAWTWSRYIRLGDLGEALGWLLQRRPAILVTGHYGNWELLGYLLGQLGVELVAVMRPLDNPYLNDYLVRTLQRAGLNLLYKRGMTRSADDVLARRGALCFIADQNAGHKGLFVDFFGRKASTYKSIGLLAIRHRVPIIVGYARRIGRGFSYEVAVKRFIDPAEWQGRDDELLWITQEYTRAIEQFVREAPDQYLWVHRRWKTRPRDESVSALAGESVARPVLSR